jgi:hypothetical protein
MGIKDWFSRRKKKGPTEIGVSPGGSRLMKYPSGEPGGPRIGFTEESTLELVQLRETVYGELFGESDTVFHELLPLVPHIDVYRFQPSNGRDFYTFVTGGMSDLPMSSPKQMGADVRRAELVFYAADDGQEYAELLRSLAHFPHDNRTWLHWGHTMPNGNPPQPILDAQALDTFLFLPTIVIADSELGKRLSWNGDPINLLWVVPISTTECNLKLEHGTDAVFDLFDSHEHPCIWQGPRESYV